jgi:GT2 family glycosyltransferase
MKSASDGFTGQNASEAIPRPRVAVVLVNWNGWRDCVECLDTLLAIAYPAFDVFLVDNDSSDRSVENIVAWCKCPVRDAQWRDFPGVKRISAHGTPVAHRVLDAGAAAKAGAVDRSPFGQPEQGPCLTIVRSGGNLGFAGGNNVGMRCAGLADFGFYWLLNTDTVVDAQALCRLVDRASQSPAAGIVGSTLCYYGEPSFIQAMGGASLDRSRFVTQHIGVHRPIAELPSDPREVESRMAYVVGASMLVRREFVETVGYMQEDYFLYYEEIDWALRGADRYTLGYAPQSIVFHKVGASSAKVAPLFSLRLMYRNRLKVVARFLPERTWAAMRRMAMEAAILFVKGNYRHTRAILEALYNSRALLREGREGGAS